MAARASAATVLLTWRKSNAEGNGLVRIPPDGEAIAEKRLGRGDRSPADEGEVVRILRDGTEIAERRLGVGRYLDEDVAPATSYTYLVQTRAADARASEFVKVTVETATPPLSAARLADVFDVRFDLRSSTGFDKLPSRSTAAWRFRPSCRQGPCDVAVSDDHGDGIHRVALTREQGRYGGSGTGRIGYACGSTPTTSSFSIDAYVLDADVVNDVWRATKLGGTLRVTQSQQLGCTSGSILMGFTATLVTRN